MSASFEAESETDAANRLSGLGVVMPLNWQALANRNRGVRTAQHTITTDGNGRFDR